MLLQLGNVTESLLVDIWQAYRCIFAKVDAYMSQGKTSELACQTATERLRGEPWVLVQGTHFVLPSQLCFDLEADTDSGRSPNLIDSALLNCSTNLHAM